MLARRTRQVTTREEERDRVLNTHWCSGCKAYIPLINEKGESNFYLKKSGSPNGRCKPCAIKQASIYQKNNRNLSDSEMAQTRRDNMGSKYHHGGPPHGSPERYFFCRLAVPQMAIDIREARRAEV